TAVFVMLTSLTASNSARKDVASSQTFAIKRAFERRTHIQQRDADGNTALHWALWHGNHEIVREILTNPMTFALIEEPNVYGETPMMWAAKACNTVGAAMMVEAMTPASRGRDSAVQALLNTHDLDGFTLLIVCAQFDNVAMMEWLWLTGGLFIDERDNLGRTALHWAAYKGHRKSVQWLLSRGASLTERDEEGITPLHLASMQGHTMVIDTLIDVGGVYLLDEAADNGDSPIISTRRNGFQWIYLCMQKARLCNALFGRPYLSHNDYANVFVIAFILDFTFFAFLLWPWLSNDPWDALWLHIEALCLVLTITLWAVTCYSDPGWLAEYPLPSQADACREFVGVPSGWTRIPSSIDCEEALISAAPGSNAEDSRATLECKQRAIYSRASSANCRLRNGTEFRDRAFDNSCDEDPDAAAGLPGRLIKSKLADFRIGEVSESYYSSLCEGSFKQVCVICRVVHTLRSRHCKECRRCVDRLDHHCPWIDNCVGIRNQRSFYLFLLVLLAGLVIVYYLVFRFVSTVTVQATPTSKLDVDVVTSAVLLFAAANLLWAGFVTTLLIRQTCFMLLNLTTAE
ncbi:hypothetical protein FOZ63_005814, partial [Perkinsus olseni]